MNRFGVVFFFLLCLIASVMFTAETNADAADKRCDNVAVSEHLVIHELTSEKRSYSKFGRPVKTALGQPVFVNIGMRLSGIQDFLERQSTLILTGYLVLEWWDQFLVWNDIWPLNCIDRILLPISKIWHPDIACVNSAENFYGFLGDFAETYRALVNSSGYVIHNPVGQIRVSCQLDLQFFPFDTQACAVRFESWMLPNTMERFKLDSNPFQRVDDKLWTENEQWHIVGNDSFIIESDYFDGDKYDHAVFLLLMKRKFVFYVVNIVTPSILISAVELVIFLLPTTEVLKIHISFTCLLAYSVFQTMVIGDLPRSSDNVPLLSLYIDLQMIFLSLSLLGEGFVFVLAERSKGDHEMPRWLLSIFNIMSRVLLVNRDRFLSSGDTETAPTNGTSLPSSAKTNQLTDIPTVSHNGNSDNHVLPPQPPPRHLGLSKILANKLTQNRSLSGQQNVDAETSLSINSIVVKVESSETRPRVDSGNSRINLLELARRNANSKLERQRRWMFAAEVAERFNACFYALAICFTPFVMFVIIPLGNESITDQYYWRNKFTANATLTTY